MYKDVFYPRVREEREMHLSIEWWLNKRLDFSMVCDYAGLNPEKVKKHFMKRWEKTKWRYPEYN